jgi:GNAT superfamily N-acetyltransferase
MDRAALIPVGYAERGDLPRVLDLLRTMHAETQAVPLVEDRMIRFVLDVFERGAIGVSWNSRAEIVGVCGLVPDAPWFSDRIMVRDVWLFVAPAARREPHARALLRWAKTYARALGAPLVVEVQGGRRTAAKVRLYRRELGPVVGATWMVE